MFPEAEIAITAKAWAWFKEVCCCIPPRAPDDGHGPFVPTPLRDRSAGATKPQRREAVITVVPAQQAAAEIRTLRDLIQHSAMAGSDQGRLSDARMGDTRYVFDSMLELVNKRYPADLYALASGGVSAGLMYVEEDMGAIEVLFMVAHPGSPGTGTALLEKAVGLSMEAGLGGVVRVNARTAAVPLYEKAGFIPESVSSSSTKMALDPAATGSGWELVGGSWRRSATAG